MERDWQPVIDRLMADAAKGSALLAVSHPKIKRALGAGANSIVRWIVSGKRGVYLDGTKAGGKSWSTTQAACARFLIAITQSQFRKPLPAIVPSEKLAEGARLGDLIRAIER